MKPDWDSLVEALQEIVAVAIPLLRADGAGLMLADRQGALRWVTATNQAERAFEQAERDLGEGPCIDAFTAGQLVWTSDLRADPAGRGSARRPAPTRSAGSCPRRWSSATSPSGPATPSPPRPATGPRPTPAPSGPSPSCSAA